MWGTKLINYHLKPLLKIAHSTDIYYISIPNYLLQVPAPLSATRVPIGEGSKGAPDQIVIPIDEGREPCPATLPGEQEVHQPRAKPAPDVTWFAAIEPLCQVVGCVVVTCGNIWQLLHCYSTEDYTSFGLTLLFVLLTEIVSFIDTIGLYRDDWKSGKEISVKQWTGRGIFLILLQTRLMRLVKH